MTIDVIGIGAAPGDNTGDGLRTAMTKVNNNFGSSANAASKLVGTDTGQVPTADDLGVVGETNWSSGNLQKDTPLGVGVWRLMINNSGATIGSGAVVPGSSLLTGFINTVGAVLGSGVPTGTWRNVQGNSLTDGFGGYFVKDSN